MMIKNNSNTEELSDLNNNQYSEILLENCGFSKNFFTEIDKYVYAIEKNSMKKVNSANGAIAIPLENNINNNDKKIYEAEDKDSFLLKEKEEETEKIINKNNDNSNIISNSNNNIIRINLDNDNNENANNNNNDYSKNEESDNKNLNINKLCYEEFNKKFNSLINNINKDIKETKTAIKAYRSRHKSKFTKVYEINSYQLLEKNKFKLFHKCCFPDCKRTFSSSGWLKAHYKEHLKELHKSNYCKLFEQMVISEHIKKIEHQKKNEENIFNENHNSVKSNLFRKNQNQNIWVKLS